LRKTGSTKSSHSESGRAEPGRTEFNRAEYVGGFAGRTDSGRSNLDINQSVPGRLQIPSLKIDAPLIWSSDPKNFDTDLQSGVIHYPGTALPGEIGTTYISGHSSNYSWAKAVTTTFLPAG